MIFTVTYKITPYAGQKTNKKITGFGQSLDDIQE